MTDKDTIENVPASLEKVVEEEETVGITDKNLDTYVAEFTRQYQQEETFKGLVHQYLNLTVWNRLGLTFAKIFRKNWYQQKTAKVVEDYAHKVLEDTKKTKSIQKDLEEITQLSRELEERAKEVKATAVEKEEAKEGCQKIEQEQQEAKQEVVAEYQNRKKQIEQAAAAAQQQIQLRTDAEAIVKGKLKEYVIGSGMVKVDQEGRLTFDEEKMMTALEDKLLNETIDAIEKEDSRTGFLARVKDIYDGTIASFDEMSSYDTIHSVEWTQTIIHAREQGQEFPRLPHHFIYGVPGTTETKGKASIDTAIVIDRSGSMKDNGRWTVAQQTGFSARALMRKLNPDNNTYFAVYNNQVTPVNSAELKKIIPDGGTSTHLAVDWLVDTLKDGGPALAYLITDGAPDSVDEAVKAAEKFREYPYLRLRILLVDGDPTTKNIVRRIGKAAGEDTKVMNINNYELRAGMIRNLHESIGDLQSITDF